MWRSLRPSILCNLIMPNRILHSHRTLVAAVAEVGIGAASAMAETLEVTLVVAEALVVASAAGALAVAVHHLRQLLLLPDFETFRATHAVQKLPRLAQ